MLLSLLLFFKFLFPGDPQDKGNVPKTIYDFKVEGLEGDVIDFSKFKGKKILIVNTASKCGYTPQYGGLQELYTKHKDNLVIVGFPSNDFMNQEPGTNEQIAEFCERNYGVQFPMAAKTTVLGKETAPIYQWLTKKQYNGYMDSKVKWNFQKFLINERGELVGIFYPQTDPLDPEVLKAIDQVLTADK
jgi:glutathione peroxidase